MKRNIFFLIFIFTLIAGIVCGQKGADIEPYETKVFVDSIDGLSLRTEPNRAARRLTVFPFGTELKTIERVKVPVEIDGIKGHWTHVRKIDDSNLQTGWIFGGYVSNSLNLDKILKSDVIYRAEYSWGAFGTDASTSTTEEIKFLKDRYVQFTSKKSGFDWENTTKYDGLWHVEDGTMVLDLKHGTVSRKVYDYDTEVMKEQEDTLYPSGDEIESENTNVPTEIILILLWRADLAGFIRSDDMKKMEGGSWVLNKAGHRFEQKTEKEYSYTGYFAPVK